MIGLAGRDYLMGYSSDHSLTLHPYHHSTIRPQVQTEPAFFLSSSHGVLFCSDADELFEDVTAEIGSDATCVIGQFQVEHEARTVFVVFLAVEAIAEVTAGLYLPLADQTGLVRSSFSHGGDGAAGLDREYSI